MFFVTWNPIPQGLGITGVVYSTNSTTQYV